MPISDCNDCQRLWHAYALATTRHIELSGKQRIAHLQRDQEAFQRLEKEIEAAGQSRDSAREAIRLHEASAHSAAQPEIR